MISTAQLKNLILERIDLLRQRLATLPKPGVPSHVVEMGKAQVCDSIADLEAELASKKYD